MSTTEPTCDGKGQMSIPNPDPHGESYIKFKCKGCAKCKPKCKTCGGKGQRPIHDECFDCKPSENITKQDLVGLLEADGLKVSLVGQEPCPDCEALASQCKPKEEVKDYSHDKVLPHEPMIEHCKPKRADGNVIIDLTTQTNSGHISTSGDNVDVEKLIDSLKPAAVGGEHIVISVEDCNSMILAIRALAAERNDLEVERDTFWANSQDYLKRAEKAEADLEKAEARPTEWAYKQACRAIEKHRVRADRAEAELKELGLDYTKMFLRKGSQ